MKPLAGKYLTRMAHLHGLERKFMESDKSLRARCLRRLEVIGRRAGYNRDLRTESVLLRILRFLFKPDQCWACGGAEKHHVTLDVIDVGVGPGLECEAEVRCFDCGTTTSGMSYSEWGPDIGPGIMNRIQFLQAELNQGPRFLDIGVLR